MEQREAEQTRRGMCDLAQAQIKQIIEVVRKCLWLLPRRNLFSLDHLAPLRRASSTVTFLFSKQT
jgi:hypothetical protein